MRNMSFALTTEQVQAEEKDITRRFGWWFLKPGDRVRPVRKSMGLKKGERIEPLLPAGRCIEIVSTRDEPLKDITKEDCVREGFGEMEPSEFVEMISKHYSCPVGDLVNRIEFRYVEIKTPAAIKVLPQRRKGAKEKK